MSTPIKLYELTLRNFKSFGNNLTKLTLDGNNVTLILGRNLDASVNGQIESNGSGKTTILDAISYCFYDKTISKISKDDLINNINKKNMEVSVAFEKDGLFYRIVRYRKNKAFGGNGVAIFKGNTLAEVDYDILNKDNDIAEAGTADAQILKLIGIPYDIFSRIIIFSATHEPFLSLPASSTANKANQRDIMEELQGLTELSEKAEILKKEISDNNKELATLTKVEEELNKQKEKIKTQVENLRTRVDLWNVTKANNIRTLNNNIESLSAIDYDAQSKLLDSLDEVRESIKAYQDKVNLNKPTISSIRSEIQKYEQWDIDHTKEIKTLKESIESLDDVDFDYQRKLINEKTDITASISDIKTKRSPIEHEHNEAFKQYTDAGNQIAHLADNKCPYCLQQFADAKSKVADLEQLKIDTYNVHIAAKKKLVELTNQISNLENRLSEISNELKFKSLDALHKEKSIRDSLTTRFKEKVLLTNPYGIDDLDNVKASLEQLETKNKKLISTIDELKVMENGLLSKLSFKDKVLLERSRMQVDSLKTDLEREEKSENPHLSSLADLEGITMDGSNADSIANLEKIITHKTFLHKLLTKPDSFIRKSLLADRLKYTNQQLRYYLDILGLPHKVEFTEELEAKISQFGNELQYTNLSSGQKARVNIALSFAFRDVLQARYGKINFCILDECLDVGLSSVGVTQAVQMIKKVAADNKLSMFVISHRDETVSSFNHVLEIELSNGFSSIIK